jgi:hypothetical protein
MVQIEFFDPEDSGRPMGPDPAEEIGHGPSRWASLDPALPAAGVLLAAAAALAAIAPFQQLFVIRQPGAGRSLTFAADGWGRVSVNEGAGALGPFHFSRFGIPLLACAGLLVILLAVLLAAAAGVRWAERALTGAGLAAVTVIGTLVGVLASMVLLADSQFDSSQTSTVDVELGRPSIPDYRYGACPWLVAAAVVAVVLALGAASRWRRR